MGKDIIINNKDDFLQCIILNAIYNSQNNSDNENIELSNGQVLKPKRDLESFQNEISQNFFKNDISDDAVTLVPAINRLKDRYGLDNFDSDFNKRLLKYIEELLDIRAEMPWAVWHSKNYKRI